MAKQTINVGTTANDRKGDSLRAAFQKVNANFSELYTALGLTGDATLNLGAFEFTGSTMSTTNSSAIVIDQATTVTSNLTVGGDILPSIDNNQDIGSPAKQWRHIYMSGGSIYLDNIKLTNNAGKLEIIKVINPGEENEAPDPEDSNAGSAVTNKLVNGEQEFILETDGSVTIPNGGKLGPVQFPTGNEVYTEGNDGYSQLNWDNTNFVWTDNAGASVQAGSKTWAFGSSGNLTLPPGGDILDSAGNSVLGGGGGFSLPPDTTFDDFYEDGGATIYNSGGKIQLYSLVSEGNDGVNIRVKGDGGDSTWEFKSNGSITFPDNELKTSIDNDLSIVTESSPTEPPTTIEIVGADFVAVNLTYTQSISDPNAWIPANYNPATDPYIQFDNGYGIWHPAFEQPIYVNTGTLNVPLEQWNTNPPLGSVPPTGVYTYPNTYTKTWTFDNEGAINLPDPGTIRNTSGAANLVATDYAQLQWTTQAGANDPDPNGTQEPKNWVYVEVGGAYIETNINGLGSSHSWHFGNDGVLTLPQGGDIQNSAGNSVLGGSVVERSVEFPLGESGDTRGTIALTPNGTTYICTADWVDASTGLQGTFTAVTLELYDIGQGGGVYNSAILSIADEPEIYNILRYGSWTEGQFTIDAGPTWGGAKNVTSTGYNDQAGTMSVLWAVGPGDPQQIPLGTSVTVVYTGGGTQTPIWKKLVDLTSEGYGDGTINWTNEGDLTIETLRPQGYNGDCDVNIYGADDIWIEAKGDQAEIKAFSDVRIASDGGNHQWTFTKAGAVQLPYLNNIGYQNGYGLNGPTLRLGGENDPNDQVIITGPVPDSNNASAQRLVIQGQRGFGDWNQPAAGEGGDVYIWGGTGGEGSNGGNYYGGSGGDIKIRGGQGQNNAGGYVKIEGGSAADWNGGSHTGGYIEISAGDATGGANGNGGDVNIRGGRKQGTGNNGEVNIRTGANSEHEWRFDNGGGLNLPTNGGLSFNYGYIDQDTTFDNNTLRLSGGDQVGIYSNEDSKRWLFKADGTLELPAGGDIVDSNGDSVLGVGAPTIPSTVKGWYQIQGPRPNNNDEVAFQTVAVTPGGEAFTAGKNYYADNRGDATIVIQKHSTSGEVLLSKRIGAGYGATLTVVVAGGVLSVTGVTNLGSQRYQVNEKLVMWGAQWNDYSYSSIWTVNVDSVDGNGAILTASVVDQPITPPADGTYNSNSPVRPDLTLYANSMVYNNECEQVFLVAEYQSGYKSQYDSNVTWAMVYVLDSSTLAVMATYLLRDEADLHPISITANDNGDIAVVGQKFNEYRTIPITGYTGGNQYLAVSKTVMGEHFPESGIPGDEYYNFFVQGTGITGQAQVDSVNLYPSLATTVREGSGAAFNIWNNGDGTYGWNGITYGTNYRVGHKIKLLGSDLGGTSPANDAIVTVTGINNDVQGGISNISISGSAAGVGPQVNYPNVSGTNYQVGSGARVNINVDPVTDLITSVGTDNFGDYHYVVGDVLTVSGTVFPGGTSPANDVVLTVTAVYLGGPNGYTVVSGTPPTDILRLNVSGYDFSTGTYTMRQSLNSEAFVWTPGWNKAIGGGSDDYFQSVIFGSDGTHIYAVGKGRYEVTYDQALVVKMTKGNGTIVWSKYVNSYLSPGSEVGAWASSVIQLNNNNIVVSVYQYNNSFSSNEIGLVALDTDGVLQWTRTYLLDNGSMDSEHRLLRDGSDNIYIVFRGYNARNGDDAYNILKLDSTGAKIWARAITNNSMYMDFAYSWGNEFAAISNTHLYIAGYTSAPNDNYYSGLLIRFPVDGYKEFAEEGWARGESFGDLSLFKPTTITTTPVATPQTFTPDVHSDGITTVANYNMGYTYTDDWQVPALLVKMTRDDLGYLEFGDGSKQSFATDRIPQILVGNNQQIKLSPQDSGKHYFIGPDQAGVDFIIPEYDIEDPYPVGYTVTIVNCSGGDVYVNMYAPTDGNYYYGSIWGAGRDIQTRYWGIPDSGSGSLVTLMKVKNAEFTGGENISGTIWMIAGPSDIYNND